MRGSISGGRGLLRGFERAANHGGSDFAMRSGGLSSHSPQQARERGGGRWMGERKRGVEAEVRPWLK